MIRHITFQTMFFNIHCIFVKFMFWLQSLGISYGQNPFKALWLISQINGVQAESMAPFSIKVTFCRSKVSTQQWQHVVHFTEPCWRLAESTEQTLSWLSLITHRRTKHCTICCKDLPVDVWNFEVILNSTVIQITQIPYFLYAENLWTIIYSPFQTCNT